MGKRIHADVLDGALGYFGAHCDKLVICTVEPAGYAEATGAALLAEAGLDAGDFTLADGDTGGRKMSVAAQPLVPVTTGGAATHIALLDTATSRVLLVTTMTEKVMAAGDYANVPAFDFEIGDPV